MCSVLLLHRVLVDAPMAVFFVRDEALARGGGPAELRGDLAGVIAPRDPRAGGTWFGLSQRGFVAGLVNRREDPLPPTAASRGQLMLEALRQDSASAALAAGADVARLRVHGGCRVFAGDADGLGWLDLPAGGEPGEPRRLAAGTWLLRHHHGPEAAPEEFLPRREDTAAAWFDRAAAMIAAHRPPAAPLCRHGDMRGSVDASQAAVGVGGEPLRFHHRQGPPCGGPFEDVLDLFGT